MAISIQTQFADNQSMARPFHRLYMQQEERHRSWAGDRNTTDLMHGGCTDPPDHSARTRNSANPHLDPLHGKPFGDKGHRLEKAARNDEPRPRTACCSSSFLSLNVKKVHFNLPDTHHRPSRSSTVNKSCRLSGVRSLIRIKDKLGRAIKICPLTIDRKASRGGIRLCRVSAASAGYRFSRAHADASGL